MIAVCSRGRFKLSPLMSHHLKYLQGCSQQDYPASCISCYCWVNLVFVMTTVLSSHGGLSDVAGCSVLFLSGKQSLVIWTFFSQVFFCIFLVFADARAVISYSPTVWLFEQSDLVWCATWIPGFCVLIKVKEHESSATTILFTPYFVVSQGRANRC